MSNGLTCPYCEQQAQLTTGDYIYPHRKDLASKQFWVCWPCDAYVGCHGSSNRPLGRLANEELRKARTAAHAAFDPLWRSRRFSRTRAYVWLASQLGIKTSECHIAMFDVEKCKSTVAAVYSLSEVAS
jgi:hypothetical protein